MSTNTSSATHTLRRQVCYQLPDGSEGTAEITIEWPAHNGSEWECRYVLSGVPFVHPSEGHTLGEDPLQELLLCLQTLRVQLEGAADAGYVIWWLEQGDLAGLSISPP